MSHAESSERFIADPRAYFDLEQSYRRLLSRYPARYRAARQEEMLATLMESSSPGQRRPSARDAADLAVGAARAHLRLTVLPAPARAISAVALPAALILVGLLLRPINAELITVLTGHLPNAHGLDHGGSTPVAVQVALYVLPIVAGIALAVALLIRKHQLVRRLSTLSLPVLLAGPALAEWHVAALLSSSALIPAMLAGLVAVAQPADLEAPRRQRVMLAAALLVAPILAALAANLVAMKLMSGAPPFHSTPEILLHAPTIALAAGLLVTMALLTRWRERGATLGSVLLVCALLPGLNELLSTSSLWRNQFRVPAAVAAIVVVLGTAGLAAYHRRWTRAGSARSASASASRFAR